MEVSEFIYAIWYTYSNLHCALKYPYEYTIENAISCSTLPKG